MKKYLVLLTILCFAFEVPQYSQKRETPGLTDFGSTQQLMVEGKPFLILGGELGNSSASSLTYMAPAWEKFRQMNLNTILVPVYWELMEPREGEFDFTLVDSLLQISNRNNLKVILLWFGSWKNSMSCYAPSWIKTNTARFPRAKDRDGNSMEILSAFSQNNLDADMKAFSALMKHIKKTDRQSTVIMVQVENEIGMLGEARERTRRADSLFYSPVPAELIQYMQANKNSLLPELKGKWEMTGFTTEGNWEKVFGKSLATDEFFQAWYYAKYVNSVAEAGRKEYDIPMYVNAALNYKNVDPGQYPSAGPLPHLMDIWQASAPAIDFLSPDFYNPYFRKYNDEYTQKNNLLFIPEIRFESGVEAKVFYAIGHCNAIGFSPFSIESTEDPQNEAIGKSYSILSQVSSQVLKNRGTEKMDGVLLDNEFKTQEIVMGKYKLMVAHDYTLGWSPEASKPGWTETGGIIIQEGENDFLVAGTGIVITFSEGGQGNQSVGILQAEEGNYVNGKWVAGRRMNGDQDHQGRHIRIPEGEWGIQRFSLYTF
ncbi:MAG: DUF5597 domain-containing protein [Bacteroidales bacterium]|nr:DUF5597 domain-containing protein [Bacteroidales bacterium]MCB9013702.1 DUF5597 domain-containing protein [Bacteroidales bacterium]